MYNVYTDESGSNIYDDLKQPVLCLTAVIIDNNQTDAFEKATENLLRTYGLPIQTEIHCNPCLMCEGEFEIFDKSKSYEFLKCFLNLGMRYISAIQNAGSLKRWVKADIRRRLYSRGLDLYTAQVAWNAIIIDRYVEHILNSDYRYFFDQTVQFAKPVKTIINTLYKHENPKLRLNRMCGEPTELDSQNSRSIQLADVAGYYFNRNHQIEIPNFRKSEAFRKELEKHESKILDMYRLMEPKVLRWIENDLFLKIDFNALENLSIPRR